MEEEFKFTAVVHDDAGTARADGILPESEETLKAETRAAETKTEPEVVEIPGFHVSTNEAQLITSPEETAHVEFAERTAAKTEPVAEPEEKAAEETVEKAENETVAETGEKTEEAKTESEPDRPDREDRNKKRASDKDKKDAPYVPTYDTTDDRESGDVRNGIIPEKPTEVVGVRFRSAGKIYYFSPGELKIRRGDHVLVETARGMEYGTVAGNPLVVTKKQFNKPLRVVSRLATEADKEKAAENRLKEKEAYKVAREKIAKHGLDMKLVSAEYTFDRGKLMFYFTADGRIDFRDLVKDLASVFRTRIELRQIGVRDETRMLGGYGPCGRPLCCSAYLTDFVPVSIKMAKEQSLSLNPTKISGVCGRLMCCLKNEEDTYEDLNRNLPGIGDEVRGQDGLSGEVEGVNVLRQRIRVMVDVDDEKEIHEYGVGEFEITHKRRRGDRRHKAENGAGGEAGQAARGGRKPLSTVAAAVAAKQKREKEEEERRLQESAGEETPEVKPEGEKRHGRGNHHRRSRHGHGQGTGQGNGQGNHSENHNEGGKE